MFEVNPKVLTKDFGAYFLMRSLNINAKLMVVKAEPPHFRTSPKISRRFFKTSPRLSENAVTFLKKTTVFERVHNYSEYV